MKRVISFTETRVIVVNFAAGQEIFTGKVTLPLRGTFLIEQASCFVRHGAASYGKIFGQGTVYFYDGVTYQAYKQGYGGFFSIYPESGDMGLYNQNEISGTNFDSFAVDNKVNCEFEKLNEPNVIFTGKEINVYTVFKFPPTFGGLTYPEALWNVTFHYNIVLNDNYLIDEAGRKRIMFENKEEKFDFSPKGSSFGTG